MAERTASSTFNRFAALQQVLNQQSVSTGLNPANNGQSLSSYNRIAALRQTLNQRNGSKYMDYSKEQSIDLALVGSLGNSPSKTAISYTPPVFDLNYVFGGYSLYGYIDYES